MKKYLILATLITAIIVLPIGWYLGNILSWSFFTQEENFLTPIIPPQKKQLPLLQYGINNLSKFPFQNSELVLKQILASTPAYTSYLFSFQTLNKTMTGQLNVPNTPPNNSGYPVIVMLRGYVPIEIYQTGVGTQAAAAVFAQHGFVTLAPDFFGYGGSEPETSNSWEARFQKPLSVIELLKNIAANSQITPIAQTLLTQNAPPEKLQNKQAAIQLDPHKVGLWAHSNGGQIALTVLEALAQPLPTTLWAPVTAPFPYSILFFSDENLDEGKEMRKWLSLFEEDYDVFEFSLTQHLDKLSGSIQLHQGLADEAIPAIWNEEFIAKIKAENQRREQALATIKTSTQAAALVQPLPLIELNYFKYPGANHNLQPSWNTVVQRDLDFFHKNLSP